MKNLKLNGKTYLVNEDEFLIDPSQWDENFAELMAKKVEIPQGLTDEHWKVISFVRSTTLETGRVPLVFQVCRGNRLTLGDLKQLFPTGYIRGACKLAGLSYREGYVQYATTGKDRSPSLAPSQHVEKIYRLDVRGFLIDPEDWDENFAENRAFEMKIANGLTADHWKIIKFIRGYFQSNRAIPTIYETCETNGIDIVRFEQLFPDGYHRGAVKVAGLRLF